MLSTHWQSIGGCDFAFLETFYPDLKGKCSDMQATERWKCRIGEAWRHCAKPIQEPIYEAKPIQESL